MVKLVLRAFKGLGIYQDLPSFLFFRQHTGSQFPNQGLNWCLLHWKHGVLTTGPPGQSPGYLFLKQVRIRLGWLQTSEWPTCNKTIIGDFLFQPDRNLQVNCNLPGTGLLTDNREQSQIEAFAHRAMLISRTFYDDVCSKLYSSVGLGKLLIFSGPQILHL